MERRRRRIAEDRNKEILYNISTSNQRDKRDLIIKTICEKEEEKRMDKM